MRDGDGDIDHLLDLRIERPGPITALMLSECASR